MKINKEKITSILTTNLNKIFTNSFLLNKFNDNVFADLVLKNISILAFLEKKSRSKSSKKEYTNWLKKFNEVLGEEKTIIELNYETHEEVLDDVNYLSTYIKNIYKIDFDNNIIEEKKVEDVEKVDSKIVDEDSFNSFGSPFGRTNSSINSSAAFSSFQEQFYQQKTMERFYTDLISGKFYQYKSKPKIIPILKYLTGTIMLCFVITLLTNIIFAAMLKQLPVPNSGSNNENKSINLLQSILNETLVIILISYLIYKLLNWKKNDNIKYFYSWKLMLFVGVILLFSTIWSIVSNVQIWNFSEQILSNSTVNKTNFYGYMYSTFVSYGFLGLWIIIVPISTIFNPKLDLERSKKKKEMIYQEVKNEDKTTSIN